MINFLLANDGTAIASYAITVIIAIIGIAIAVLSIIAFFVRISIMIKYYGYRNLQNSIDMTAKEISDYFLKVTGIEGVKVKKASFFRAMIYGNSYSVYKNTIFLRRSIFNEKSLTAVATACQKVGLAVQHKNKDKKFLTVYKFKPLIIIAPFLFLPIALAGVLLDLFVFKGVGIFTVITSSIAFLYFIISFVVMMFTISVEKKANEKALELMKEHKILTEEENKKVKSLFDTFIKAYIIDFIINILYIVWYVLKIVLKVINRKKK